jgi:hypothetical protein
MEQGQQNRIAFQDFLAAGVLGALLLTAVAVILAGDVAFRQKACLI